MKWSVLPKLTQRHGRKAAVQSYIPKETQLLLEQTNKRQKGNHCLSFSILSFLLSGEHDNLTVVVCSGQIHIVQTNADKGEGGGWQIKINHTGV